MVAFFLQSILCHSNHIKYQIIYFEEMIVFRFILLYFFFTPIQNRLLSQDLPKKNIEKITFERKNTRITGEPVYYMDLDNSGNCNFWGRKNINPIGKYTVILEDSTVKKIFSLVRSMDLQKINREKTRILDSQQKVLNYSSNKQQNALFYSMYPHPSLLDLENLLTNIIERTKWKKSIHF